MAKDVKIKITADAAGMGQGVDQAKSKLGELKSAGHGTVGSFGDLRGAVMGAVGALGLIKGFQIAGELRQMGSEIGYLNTRFEALVGGPAAAADAMDMLRQKTGGVISDMQLTRDALSLMMTGVASDVTEAAELVQMGIQLAGQEGAEVLGQALKNQSIQLLDNLGVSASAVRELRAQYVAAGMDSGEAFTQAFKDVARGVIADLGDAADAGITSFDRLRVRFENGMQATAITVSDIIEGMARDLETMIEVHDAYWATQRNNPSPGVTRVQPGATAGAMQSALLRNPAMQLQGVINREQAIAGYEREQQERRINRIIEERAATQARLELSTANTSAYFGYEALGMMAGGEGMFGDRRGRIGSQRLFDDADVAAAEEYVNRLTSFYDQYKDTNLLSEEQLARAKEWADQGREWLTYIEKGAEAAERMTMAQMFGQRDGGRLGELGDTFLARMRGELPDDEFQSLEDALGLRTGRETNASLAWRDTGLQVLEQVYETFGRDAVITALESYERGARAAAMAGDDIGNPWTLMGYLSADNLIPINPVSNDPFGRGPLGSLAYGADQNAPGALADQGRGPLGALTGQMGTFGTPDVTAQVTAMQEIAADTAKTATSSSVWSTAVGAVGSALPVVSEGAGKLSDHMEKASSRAKDLKDYIYDVAGKVHVVKLKMDVDDRNIPQWMNDWLKAGLAGIMNEQGGGFGGAEPSTQGRIARVE